MITQFFGDSRYTKVTKTGASAVQLAAGTQVKVGGQGVVLKSALNCDLTTNGLGGLDTGSLIVLGKYYLYVVITGSSFGLVASLSATGPSGFLAYKKVGFFRTDGLGNVGDIFNFGEPGIVSQYYFGDVNASYNVTTLLDSDGFGLFIVDDSLVGSSVSFTALEDINITLGGEVRSTGGNRAYIGVFDGNDPPVAGYKVGTIDINGATNPSASFYPEIFLRAGGPPARVEYFHTGGLSEARVTALAKAVLNIDWT